MKEKIAITKSGRIEFDSAGWPIGRFVSAVRCASIGGAALKASVSAGERRLRRAG